MAPTCAGNTFADSGVLCTSALVLCPDEGDIAHWVWRQTIEVGSLPDPGGWVRVVDPPYRCLGPGEVGVDVTAAVAATVQREFSSYPIRRGSTVVDPEGRTLVQFPTRLWTDAGESYTFTRAILGRRVTITAEPREWVFHFGDGETARRTEAPRPDSDDLTHAYDKAERVQPYVVITWGGSFVIEGSGTRLPVRGTATTTGAPTPVTVSEARSQYES